MTKSKIKGKEGYKQGVTLEGKKTPESKYEPDDEGVDADAALAEIENKNPGVLDPIAATVAAAGLSSETVGDVNKDAGSEAPAIPGRTDGYDMVEAKGEAVLMCAKLCHAVVAAFNGAFGEVTLPFEGQVKDSTIAGVQFVIDDPTVTPEQQHESWMAAKLADGWQYGPTKSAEHKTHPCLVSYDRLPPRQKAKDFMFGAIVRTFFGL